MVLLNCPAFYDNNNIYGAPSRQRPAAYLNLHPYNQYTHTQTQTHTHTHTHTHTRMSETVNQTFNCDLMLVAFPDRNFTTSRGHLENHTMNIVVTVIINGRGY